MQVKYSLGAILVPYFMAIMPEKSSRLITIGFFVRLEKELLKLFEKLVLSN